MAFNNLYELFLTINTLYFENQPWLVSSSAMGSRNTRVSAQGAENYKFKPYALSKLEPRNGASQLPKGRSGHRIVSDNSNMYSFGGFNPVLDDDQNLDYEVSETNLFKELWRYNIACNEWEKLVHYTSSLPKELASNAVIMKGNTIIVHGGTGVPFGRTCSNTTYVSNLKLNKNLERLNTCGAFPLPQYGQAMVLFNSNLYVIGGTSGSEYNVNIHCLDLKTKVWSAVYISKGIPCNEPSGRYRHEVAIYKNKIIIVGGGTANDVCDLENLPAFNLETNEWETLATIGDPNSILSSEEHQGFPAPRKCHGCVQLPEEDGQDSKVVICGGCNGVKAFSDIWTLNLKTMQWTKWEEELRYALNFHSASLSPCGKMFIFGGICELFNEYEDVLTIRTNEIFSCWVKIPKLSEICWEALLYYSPDLTKLPKSKLLNSGIPFQFVGRIQPSLSKKN